MSVSTPKQPDPHAELREALRALCKQYDSAYWQKVDEARGYPEEFVKALTDAGWLAALIPEEYGGSGLTLAEASVIMEEINRSGGNSGACHGAAAGQGGFKLSLRGYDDDGDHRAITRSALGRRLGRCSV